MSVRKFRKDFTSEEYARYLEEKAKDSTKFIAQPVSSGSKRKLVTVQRIESLTPIKDADRIELATMEGLGWKCVIKKGDYKVGQDVVYFEIDSFIPATRYEFEFLRNTDALKKLENGTEGYKIKTKRFKGQISQGLIMPMNILPMARYTIGQEVSHLLGVIKYEPPIPKCLTGLMKGRFPDFIIKTDETRVQVLLHILKRHVNTQCYVTEKINGSSFTAYLNEGVFGVCSRAVDLKLDEEENRKSNAYVKLAIDNDIETKLRKQAGKKNIAIQGEIYGSKICGNNLGIMGYDVRFFNIYDIDRGKYYHYKEFVKFIEGMGLKTVPVLNTNFRLTDNLEELIKLATVKSTINPNVWAEGIVIRPIREKVDLAMSGFGYSTARLSFKVINPEHALIDPE